MPGPGDRLSPHDMRRRFLAELGRGLKLVWPILAGLLIVMAGLGCAVALLEHWPLSRGVYFAFVSGLTIGYGDVVPSGPVARVLAIAIGFTGILLAGLVAAVGVQALNATLQAQREP